MDQSSRKAALLFLFLATLQQLLPMVVTSHVPGLEKYVITRKEKPDVDLFRVVYTNSVCPKNVCRSSAADVSDSKQCSCTCKPEYPTFLPELGKCSDTVAVKKTLLKSE